MVANSLVEPASISKAMRGFIHAWLLALAVVALAGCGFKGELRAPKPQAILPSSHDASSQDALAQGLVSKKFQQTSDTQNIHSKAGNVLYTNSFTVIDATK